jgi:hypothetical protein
MLFRKGRAQFDERMDLGGVVARNKVETSGCAFMPEAVQVTVRTISMRSSFVTVRVRSYPR